MNDRFTGIKILPDPRSITPIRALALTGYGGAHSLFETIEVDTTPYRDLLPARLLFPQVPKLNVLQTAVNIQSPVPGRPTIGSLCRGTGVPSQHLPWTSSLTQPPSGSTFGGYFRLRFIVNDGLTGDYQMG